MDAFYNTSLFQFSFGDPTNTIRSEIGVSSLDAPQTTQILVPLLLPFGYQVSISDIFHQTIIIQFSTYSLSSIK